MNEKIIDTIIKGIIKGISDAIIIFVFMNLATHIQESFKFSTETLILTFIILYLHNIRQKD